MSKVILETETGEIIDELVPGTKIVRPESVKYLLETVKIDTKFSKVYNTLIREVRDGKISEKELKYILLLSMYVRYESGRISYSNGRDLNLRDLCIELKTNRSTLGRVIFGLIEKGIIKKRKHGKNNAYYMNPYVCNKGKRVGKELEEMFKDTKWSNE